MKIKFKNDSFATASKMIIIKKLDDNLFNIYINYKNRLLQYFNDKHIIKALKLTNKEIKQINNEIENHDYSTAFFNEDTLVNEILSNIGYAEFVTDQCYSIEEVNEYLEKISQI